VRCRAGGRERLAQGGIGACCRAGVGASSDAFFGDVVEREWNVFTAKMIRRSGATLLPIYFPGSNSRWYQVADKISPTRRQGLLLGEIVRSCSRPQKPVIGNPVTQAEMADRMGDPRALMAWLRQKTLALKDNPDA